MSFFTYVAVGQIGVRNDDHGGHGDHGDNHHEDRTTTPEDDRPRPPMFFDTTTSPPEDPPDDAGGGGGDETADFFQVWQSTNYFFSFLPKSRTIIRSSIRMQKEN